MTDWGASGRRDSYTLELADPFTLETVGQLDFDPASTSVTWGLQTDALAQATVALAGGGDYSQGGFDRLVRIRHVARVGGEVAEEVMGTFFVDGRDQRDLMGLSTRSLSCYSTLWRLTQDALADDVYAPSGSLVTPVVSRLVTEVGGVFAAGLRSGDADTGTRGPVLFHLGTNRGEACRTMCAWVGCRLGADDWGRVTMERDLSAEELAPRYAFEAGSACVYQAGMSWDEDVSSPVNRVVAYWSREQAPDPDDGLGLTQRCVVDLDAGSRFSYERSGRRRTYVLSPQQPCTLAELEQQARAYLAAHSGSTRYVTVTHAGIPGLRAGDVVTYDNSSDGTSPVRLVCQVDQMSVASLGPGCVTESKLRVIGEG